MKDTSRKPRIVILGTGFAAVSAVKRIDLDHFEVVVLSPRNHFLFTPLLPSTTVGTVEFRSIIEPIRTVRRGIDFMQAEALSIDLQKRHVHCLATAIDEKFSLWYDHLVIAVGAINNTFGVEGVQEHTHFLKELTDARNIREHVIGLMERADVPSLSDQERRELLHFMIVGGGPTGVEFAAELHDLIDEEMERQYPDLVGLTRISLFEALETILGTFGQELQEYTRRHFDRQGIQLKLNKMVNRVGSGYLEFKDGSRETGGMIVWSTGYGPTRLVDSIETPKENGRLLTNEYLQIPEHPEVYALGDCATVAGQMLPQTAQLAMQTGKYLARSFNRIGKGKEVEPFEYKNMGMLAYIGESEALADIPQAKVRWKGVLTYFFWRSAYLTRLVSLKNKILVLFDWIKSAVFGRDMSKF